MNDDNWVSSICKFVRDDVMRHWPAIKGSRPFSQKFSSIRNVPAAHEIGQKVWLWWI